MLKNLKHSILFILIIVSLLLIVVGSLAASRPVSQVGEKGISVPKYGALPGLGIVLYYAQIPAYIDILLDNGFTEIRDLRDYANTATLNDYKTTYASAISQGVKAICGVSSNPTIITAENWPAFKQAILDMAQWSQDNGVYVIYSIIL